MTENTEKETTSFVDKDFVQNWDRANIGTFGKWAWDLVWHKWYAGKYFVIFLIMFWIGIVTGVFDWIISAIIWMESEPITILSDIACVIFAVWLLWFSVNVAKWFVQKVWDFFRAITWERIWKIVCVSIIIGIVVMLCCIVLIMSIIPESWVNVVLLILWIILALFWIFIGIRLNFAQYAVVDKWFWPIEALKYSRNITEWHFWEIVLFDLYFFAINLLWMLCLLIWLIWTVPMTYVATSKYYLILSEIYDNWLGNK